MVAWLSLILGASIGAGANAYLTLLAIGLYARFGEAAPQVQEAIAPFGSYWVIVPAGALFLVEFFADKVPALDNLWDALHTVIRPVAAIFIALTLARDTETALQIMAALGSGTIAFSTHAFKAGLRGLARLNPEPASNALSSSGLSLAEDVSVAGLMALVFAFPGLALVVIGAILVIVFVLGPRMGRLAIFAIRAAAGRLLSPFHSGRKGRQGSVFMPPEIRETVEALHRGPVEWWCGCYLISGPFFDYRWGGLAGTKDELIIVYKRWFRRCTRVIELSSVDGAALARGPLAVRITLETDESSVKLMLLSSEKKGLSMLLAKLESAGVLVVQGTGPIGSTRPAPGEAV